MASLLRSECPTKPPPPLHVALQYQSSHGPTTTNGLNDRLRLARRYNVLAVQPVRGNVPEKLQADSEQPTPQQRCPRLLSSPEGAGLMAAGDKKTRRKSRIIESAGMAQSVARSCQDPRPTWSTC
ncbi:hypothetical protein Vi05172_g464 [Venturia inaequalis]|nr:hypothetical protein Vi05172_g464 [Venturia inaequalis]